MKNGKYFTNLSSFLLAYVEFYKKKMSKEPEPKRQKMDNDNQNENAEEKQDYSTEAQKALEELDKVQTELDNLNEEASDEILKVEQKFNQQRKPHFEKRNELIKQIPNFWVTTFINHPQISSILEEEEEECLHYLTKVEIEEFEDIKAGYKLKFSFDPNPYFENAEIIKEYNWSSTEPKSTTTAIEWKLGKQKLLNGTGKNNTDRNFFKWLCDESDPMADEIAEIIKDDIWPNPLQYFLAPDLETADEDGGEEEDEEDDGEGNEELGD